MEFSRLKIYKVFREGLPLDALGCRGDFPLEKFFDKVRDRDVSTTVMRREDFSLESCWVSRTHLKISKFVLFDKVSSGQVKILSRRGFLVGAGKDTEKEFSIWLTPPLEVVFTGSAKFLWG